VLMHASRQLPAWLIFDVRQKIMRFSESLSLGQNIRIHWRNLLPIAVVAPTSLTLMAFFRSPVVITVLLVLFWTSIVYAALPILRGRTRFTFALVAVAVYVFGSVAIIAGVAAYRSFRHQPRMQAPNQAAEPTRGAVMPRAGARVTPAPRVAHL
jgi:hypothetical protein